MIIVTDRIDFVPGRREDALAWANKIRTASKKAGFAGEKNWLLLSMHTDRMTFAVQFASLAEYEERSKSAGTDPAVQALVKEMGADDWCTGAERAFSQILIED